MHPGKLCVYSRTAGANERFWRTNWGGGRWRDGLVKRLPHTMRTWVQHPREHWVLCHPPVIPALGGQRQKAHWSLLASRSSQVSELHRGCLRKGWDSSIQKYKGLGVQWETLSQEIRRWATEEDAWHWPITSTCLHMFVQVDIPTHMYL